MVDQQPEPLTVDDVRAALSPHGISVVQLTEDTSTAVLAAQALDTPVGSIVKSLLFFDESGPLLVLAAGDMQVDARKLGREMGVPKLRLAKSEEVIAVAGYAVGGVPPLGHRVPIMTFIDRTLWRYPIVYAAAGSSTAIFAVSPERLREITGATLTDATRGDRRRATPSQTTGTVEEGY